MSGTKKKKKEKFEITVSLAEISNFNILEDMDMSTIIFQQNYVQNVYSVGWFGI